MPKMSVKLNSFMLRKTYCLRFATKLFLSHAPPNIAQNILKFAMNLTEKMKIFICNKKQCCFTDKVLVQETGLQVVEGKGRFH